MKRRSQRAWYRFLQFWTQHLFVLLFRIRTFGRERIPKEGGVLLIANHQSFLDPIIVSVGLPRQVCYFAREDLFRGRFFHWLIRSLGAFPVKRGAADTAAIRMAIERLRAGEIVLLFPEGTRTNDGSVGVFHSGMCTIAARGNAPIVPVAIDGAFEAWPRNQKVFTFRPLKVAYGDPIDLTGSTRKDYHFISEEVRVIILNIGRSMRSARPRGPVQQS